MNTSSSPPTATMKMFDSHCHLQDRRVLKMVPQLLKTTLDTGVVHFAVNGTTENDWALVKELSDCYPSVVPNYGLHPWFIAERTPNWFNTLKDFLDSDPSAAVGEIGLDKGFFGKSIDFTDQVQVFRLQLQLAKELKRPASVHCVEAFGDVLEIMKSVGPFPAGVILHSYYGSAEMVPDFAELGTYFSFSGHLMPMEENKAKKMLKSVPVDRILLETDAPDALPKSNNFESLFFIEKDSVIPKEQCAQDENATANDGNPSDNSTAVMNETLNHPANIHIVLTYVASLLDVTQEELADRSYENALRVFSYEGSKVVLQGKE